jgi:hypothetical protein
MEIFLIIMGIILGIWGIWLFLVIIYNTKRRYYEMNGYRIEVYAGWINHYIKINGKIVDEIKTGSRHHLITLEAHCENLDVVVRIGQGFLGNTISTIINGIVVCEADEPVAETEKKEGITDSELREHCAEGKIKGAFLTGKTWYVPVADDNSISVDDSILR